ncbi:MaoC family dehydratase [Dietzia lutea]|uniref:Enoyl-CoA hydratase n=1 Tax=Dietzia lutea TaxID=546160 RepID=A0A2S1R9E2_9ACTN|nr:MaoC family dehydratase [Dietzia lutea]AWH92900.1 enoyl-CoA hydratase [Dietzia lutea]
MASPQHRPSSVEDLENLVDVEIGPTGWHEVDQAAINTFADVTGDHQWIHVDREKAAQSPFGTTIAHGLYSLSRTPALLQELLAVNGFAHALNYGYDRVRFIHPLPVGSRLRLRAQLTTVDEVAPGQVQVVIKLTVEGEGIDKPILVADSISRFGN